MVLKNKTSIFNSVLFALNINLINNVMKTIKLLIICAITVSLLNSCAKVFYSPDAKKLAQNHASLAILPPSV